MNDNIRHDLPYHKRFLRTCQVCGTQFYGKRTGQSCGKACKAKIMAALGQRRKPRPEQTCENCGKPFTGRQRTKTCGKECTSQLRSRTIKQRMDEGILRPFPWTGQGHLHPSWKGGRIKDSHGYILLHKPDHPMSDKNGWLREHRFVMAEHIGRMLEPFENVHHRNGVKDDNRIENLEIVTHARPNGWVICPHCRKSFQVH